jgi:drug/metabolite transporter (DMT)-like permease
MPNTVEADPRRPVLSWLALGVVYVVWGSTYLAIRVGVRHLPPLFFAGTRYVIAGGLLYPIAVRMSLRDLDSSEVSTRPDAKAWISCAVIGVLLLTAGNGGVTFAESSLPSGLTAVLFATVPLWMILFAWPLRQERVALKTAAALGLGLVGVVVLVGDRARSGRLSDVIIVLGAAAAWGFGSVLGRQLSLPRHAMLAAAMEMMIGGGVLLVAAVSTGEISQIHWSLVPATSWIALAYLIGPGSILAFSAYGYALAHLPVSTVSTYAYVNPVVAVLAGWMILGERLTWSEGLGATFIVSSIIVIMHRSGST